MQEPTLKESLHSPHKAEGKVNGRGIGRSIGLGKGTGKEPGKGPGRGGGKGGEGNDKNWYNKLTDYRKYYIQIQAIQSFKPSYIRLG